MSLFDRFVSVLKTGVPGGRVRDPAGPLGLRPGDQVHHYGTAFSVTGTRILVSEGPAVFQYCLKDDVGRRAVLVAIDGDEPEYSLQKLEDHEVRWEAESVDDFEDETYTFVSEGRARLNHIGDTEVRGCRSVEYRIYTDESGDEQLVLEDYAGTRETRRGGPLYEGEFEVVHCDNHAAAQQGGEFISDTPSGTVEVELDFDKGSPLAAAHALSQECPEAPSQEISQSDDEWSDAYDKDDWADADYDDGAPARKRPEWIRAKAIKARAPAEESAEGDGEAVAAAPRGSVFDTVIGGDDGWNGI